MNKTPIEEATDRINGILAKLESDTGQIVRELTINNIDTTTFGSTMPVRLRTARIFLERLPGSEWA